MYALNTIRTINARAARRAKVETETTRHCSYCASRDGVVLHSAKQRSTAFIEGKTAKNFLAGWLGTNSQTKRDQLVESFFATAPRGKQRIAA